MYAENNLSSNFNFNPIKYYQNIIQIINSSKSINLNLFKYLLTIIQFILFIQ